MLNMSGKRIKNNDIKNFLKFNEEKKYHLFEPILNETKQKNNIIDNKNNLSINKNNNMPFNNKNLIIKNNKKINYFLNLKQVIIHLK